MILVTHILAGLLGLKLLNWVNSLNVILVVIGSVLPDIDHKLGLRHRGVTHSVSMLVLFIIPALGLGIALHVLLDLLTPTGAQLIYPRKDWFIILDAPLRTGKHDTICIILLLGGLML